MFTTIPNVYAHKTHTPAGGVDPLHDFFFCCCFSLNLAAALLTFSRSVYLFHHFVSGFFCFLFLFLLLHKFHPLNACEHTRRCFCSVGELSCWRCWLIRSETWPRGSKFMLGINNGRWCKRLEYLPWKDSKSRSSHQMLLSREEQERASHAAETTVLVVKNSEKTGQQTIAAATAGGCAFYFHSHLCTCSDLPPRHNKCMLLGMHAFECILN